MRKLLLLAAATLVSAPLCVSSARASLISIGLQQAGMNSGNITTVGTGDGSAVFAGNYGSFTFNTVTGQGSPYQPSGYLDTGSIQANASTAGTISVYVTEQGLTSPQGVFGLLSSFTANIFSGPVTSVVMKTFVSASNALYGGTLLATTTMTAIGTNVQLDNTPLLSGAFSETVEYIITVGSGTSNVNDTINLTPQVPEPGTVALLGTGLAFLGLLVRRRSV